MYFEEDPNLSWKAKGILSFLVEFPDAHVDDIVKSATDGKSSVSAGMAELECRGYIRKIQERTKGRFGRFIYEVREDLEYDF